MEDNLSILEEFDLTVETQTPHLMYPILTSVAKQKIAISVMSRKPEDILLINATGFAVDAVLAGLTERQAEYLLMNAPVEYKIVLNDVLKNNSTLAGAFDVAKGMDEDAGKKNDFYKQRFIKVLQYLKDNQTVLNF